MPLEIGQVMLGKCQIERELGERAFGYVYEATELRQGRKVAIKELTAERTTAQLIGPKSGELFRDEKQAPFLEWAGGVVGPLLYC